MKIHAGTILSEDVEKPQLYIRITRDKETTEEMPHLMFSIHHAYTIKKEFPTPYVTRTNRLLNYISEHNPELDHALWCFYQSVDIQFRKTEVSQTHRLRHRFGEQVLALFSETRYLDTLFDFLDSRTSLQKRINPQEDELFVFSLICGLLVPVLGRMAGQLILADVHIYAIGGMLSQIIHPLFLIPRFSHIPTILMAIITNELHNEKSCMLPKDRLHESIIAYYSDVIGGMALIPNFGIRTWPRFTERLANRHRQVFKIMNDFYNKRYKKEG